MIQFQNARDVYHMVVILRCTPRCYNDDTYNLHEIKISVFGTRKVSNLIRIKWQRDDIVSKKCHFKT